MKRSVCLKKGPSSTSNLIKESKGSINDGCQCPDVQIPLKNCIIEWGQRIAHVNSY